MNDPVRMQEIIKHGYKVVLSTKHEIPFDPEELPKVMKAIADGISVLLKQGLFNPSYYVCVVEDEKRRLEFIEEGRYDERKSIEGMKPLEDIFANRRMLPALNPDGTLKLTDGKH